jgi:DNA repair exonuclease SbcCD ATPase subunit
MENQGLVLIGGENLDSTSADSNGAGKSTLFEALVWCLWGKTTRGQTGDSVVNRKTKKDCCVEVQLQHNGVRYVVKRYRKHAKHRNGLEFFSIISPGEVEDLTQGTTVLTQLKIDDFLGIDYQTFIQGPMMPQGSFRKFSEMTDAEQKVVLEQALQIGVLAAALEETKERLSAARQKLSGAEEGLRMALVRYDELTEQRASYEVERGFWERKKRLELSFIVKEMLTEHFEQEHYWLYSQAGDIQAFQNAERRRDDLKTIIHELGDEARSNMEQYQALVVEAKSDLKRYQSDMERLKKLVSKLESLSGECPTCQQEIDEEHVEGCVLKLKSEMADVGMAIEDARVKVAKIEACIVESREKYQHQISETEKELEVAQEFLTVESTRLESSKRVNQDFADSRRREEAIRFRLKHKREEISPYDQLVKNTDISIRSQLAIIRKKKAEVRGLTLQIRHLDFWRTGFSNKGLKSYILRSVTPFLNDRVTRYVQALTGGELEIEFSTQTTLKGGETREKFAVLVTNRNGAETYAGNSGGEKSRADLAINFTLSDLMATRSRRPYPQRFLDEPFESLDESGVEAVMELLAGMVADAGSVFVVTHQDSMKGLFNRTIRLVKENGQTRMIV